MTTKTAARKKAVAQKADVTTALAMLKARATKKALAHKLAASDNDAALWIGRESVRDLARAKPKKR